LVWWYFGEKTEKAEIKVGNDLLGYIEEIESNIAGFEIDFEKIVQLATEERVYAAPSKISSNG